MSRSLILPQTADRPGNTIRRELFHSPQPQGQTDNPRSDERLTQAWSIGVTDAARVPQPAPRREECPPEVYIG